MKKRISKSFLVVYFPILKFFAPLKSNWEMGYLHILSPSIHRKALKVRISTVCYYQKYNIKMAFLESFREPVN